MKPIILDKRIDSNNAAEIEEVILKQIPDDIDTILFDAKNLEYLSSAGIRLFLVILKRTRKPLTVINPPEFIEELFKMTGIDKLINLEQKKNEYN